MLGVSRMSRFRMEVVVRRWIDVPRPFFSSRRGRQRLRILASSCSAAERLVNTGS
jgi:hypothetical protein